MPVEVARGEDGVVVITVDNDDILAIDTVIEARLAAGDRRFLLDLGGHAYINSVRIATVIKARRKVEQAGGRLVLANIGPKLHAIFDILKLDRLFDLDLDHEQARAALTA